MYVINCSMGRQERERACLLFNLHQKLFYSNKKLVSLASLRESLV